MRVIGIFYSQDTRPRAKLNIILRLLIFFCFLTGLGSVSETQAGSLAKVRLSQSNVGLNSAPLWLGISQGFFAKYGLDLEPIYVRNSTIQMMALTTDQVQFSNTGGGPALNAAAKGYDLKIVATFTQQGYWDIVVNPKIKGTTDLRGKELGVTNIGGTTWIGAILGLEHFKLRPDRDDIKLQAIGNNTVLPQALISGRVDAILVDPSLTRELKKKGFTVLAELSRYNIPFASSCLVVSRAYLEKHPGIVEGVLKGLIEGTAFLYNPANQRTVFKIFAERLKITDPALAKEALGDLDKIVSRKPYPSLAGLRNIQRALIYNPNVAKVKVEDLIDDRIYRKIEDSGFIDNLYKSDQTK